MGFDQSGLNAYVDVAQRIADFRERWPEGSLQPADPANPFEIRQVEGVDKGGKEFKATFIVYRAAAYRTQDDQRPGIGMAWEVFPGRTPYTLGSELMNAETSAWGRAIVAALASDAKRGVSSREEVRNRKAEQDESWRDQPPVNGSREQSRPPENSEQVDDGEWGDWRERISAIASAEDANKLDAELRGAFKTGKVNPAKANNIRAAIQAKAASLTQEATEATPAEGETHEYDPLAQRFAGEAMAAADADALERIHNKARSAKRLSTFVKLEDPEYAGTLLSLVQARRAELEQAPATNGQPVGAQA